MLFDILLTICVVYLMILPFFVVRVITYGVKLALIEKKEDVPQFAELPKPKKCKESKAEKKQRIEKEAEIKRINSVLANIDRYDGTDNGQEEIK